MSGQKKIIMSDLALLYQSLKLTDVKTYIQSGNVIFKATEPDTDKLTGKIEKAISKACGFPASVVLRPADEWLKILKSNPYLKGAKANTESLYVALLKGEVAENKFADLLPYCTQKEKFTNSGRELYLLYPEKLGTSKLTLQIIEKTLGTVATIRNWNTMLALGEMVESEI